MNWLPTRYDITATGNSASLTANLAGIIGYLEVIPPTNGTYDFEVQDGDGCYILAETNLQGFQSFHLRKAVYGPHTIRITNCQNGNWKVKIRWQPD